MEFRMLGGLEVRDGAVALDLGPPKQRAVLAILLLEAGRVVAADRLVELLWGDDAPKALTSLQAYVSHLRRILEPGRRPRDEATVLVTQPPGYRLVVDRDDVDVLRFEDLVAAGRDRLLAGDAPGARSVLDEALALWSGPPLPELAGEPFAVEAVERLAGVRAGALEVAAEARLTLGDHAGALALLEPDAEAHPLRERFHGLLALALYRAGRQADALRAVDRCRRSLADATGLDPGPELRRLESDLLAQSPDLDWRPAAGTTPAAPAPRAVAPAEAPRVVPPIVGRDRELDQLAAAVDLLAEGRGGVALVVGDPGIGKTRLVEELVERAEGRGIAAAWARCSETGAMPPFFPAAQLADQLRAAGVMPHELIAPPVDLDDEAASQARFNVTRAVMQAMAELDRPVVLVIDDLQWADPDSLRLLEEVARDLWMVPVLVVATTRPLEESSPAGLVDCLGELARVDGAVHVALGGLDAGAVADWLARRTDVRVPGDVAAFVHDRTGGNPLFVKEVTDLLAAEGRLGCIEAVQSGRAIPPSVQFVVRRRVARLPGGTQQLLTVASVIGRGFDLDVLAAAARVDAADALDALAPALDAGLVEHDGAQFRFSHALVADALADEVNAARRAQIHAAAARTIAARSGPDLGLDAAVVAHHAIEGLLAGTGELAVDASRRAARLARERLADEDAARHWGDVAAVLARVRPGDVAGRVDALVAQTKALLRADRIHAAKEAVLAAIDVAGAAGQVDGMVQAAVLLNHAHVWTNEAFGVVDQRVIHALERTLAAMGPTDDARRADILGALASELVFADPERHRAACEAAEAAARASGDPVVLARVLIDLVLPHSPADFERRRALSEEAVALTADHDLPAGVVVAAHCSLGHVLLEAADFDGAAAHLAEARRAVEHDPASRFRPQLLWFEAGLLVHRGRAEEALALGEQAADLHRRARGYDLETIRLALQLAAASDVGGLEELLTRLGETAAVTAYPRPVAEIGAMALLEVGQRELAAAVVEPFGPDAPFTDDWTTLSTMTAALHVRSELGDAAGAASLLAQLAPYAGRWSPAGVAGSASGLVDLALARGHALLGDVDAARAAFAAAVAGHERLGTIGWLARSLVHQGAFLVGTGEADDAEAGKAALVRARELADAHGLPYVRRRLDLLGA